MKGFDKIFGIIALSAVIVFGFAACPEAGNDSKVPEDLPVAERWVKNVNQTSTATLDISVTTDGVCAITVGGVAQPNDSTDGWGIWKAMAAYIYTAETNISYVYEFEAWTQSGTRDLIFQYYWDDDAPHIFHSDISITATRKTYTITGQIIPKGGVKYLNFHCADKLGTFYVKILSITPVKTLAIQGIPQALMTEFSNSDGYIGVFPTGTTVQQAMQTAENYWQKGV